MGSPTGTWIDGRKLTQAYPVTGPVEFELGKGGPRCRVEPLAAPAGQPAPAYANAPTQQQAPVYRPKQPSSGPSAPVVAVIAGVVLLLAAGATWYFLDYRKAELEQAKADAIAAAKKNTPLPPAITEMPLPNNNTPAPPAPSNNTQPSSGDGTPPGFYSNGQHVTGLIRPTDNQRTWIAKTFPSVESVRINQVGNGRIKASGTYAMAVAPVPMGEELEVKSSGSSGKTYANDAAFAAADAAPVTLPTAVDNSQFTCFPPVLDQGQIGSCASFSSVYYAASHNIAVARGGKDQKPIPLSPRWTYTMVNHGVPGGSLFQSVYLILQQHGAPTWQDYPYPDYQGDPHKPPANIYLPWCTDPAIWRSALHNRVSQVKSIGGIDTPEGLHRLKAFLTDGYLANYATNVDGWNANWVPAQKIPRSARGAMIAPGNSFAARSKCSSIRMGTRSETGTP